LQRDGGTVEKFQVDESARRAGNLELRLWPAPLDD